MEYLLCSQAFFSFVITRKSANLLRDLVTFNFSFLRGRVFFPFVIFGFCCLSVYQNTCLIRSDAGHKLAGVVGVRKGRGRELERARRKHE